MKITAIKGYRISGRMPVDETYRRVKGGRLGAPIDVYPEFKAKGPNQTPSPVNEDGTVNRSIGVLEIETDDGVSGICIGAGLGGSVPSLAELILGRNPLATGYLWDLAYRRNLGSTPGTFMSNLAAIDIALWDLKSKHLGSPVCELLGGPAREEIPVYAMMRDYSKEPEEVKRVTTEHVAAGYRAFKWYPSYGPLDGEEGKRKTMAVVEAIREAGGPDIEIMLDCWKSWDVPYTIDMAHRLEDCRLRWIEEPVFQYQFEAYREIRRQVRVPISGGEQLYTLWMFRKLLEMGGVDIAQPDPVWCGGITQAVRIIDLAQAFDTPVVMHVVQLPVNLQITAAMPPPVVPMVEYPTFNARFGGQYFSKYPVHPENGMLKPPLRPGLYEIDESKVEKREPVFVVE